MERRGSLDDRKGISSSFGGWAAGSPRQTAHAPPLLEAHLFTFGASYLLSAEAGGALQLRYQSLGLDRRNTPQVRGTTQSVVHGKRHIIRKG